MSGTGTVRAPAPGRPLRRWREGAWVTGEDRPAVPPEEAAVAIVIDGASQAVLMATPHDLGDLALGFALTEGLIDSPADVTHAETLEVAAPVPGMAAHEARLWLRPGLSVRLAERRRSMVGPVGCGLCGVDSIAAALPAVVPVDSDWTMLPSDVGWAMTALIEGQHLRQQSPAIHGAAFWNGARALVREDVGRHNALDKLAGALAGQVGAISGKGEDEEAAIGLEHSGQVPDEPVAPSTALPFDRLASQGAIVMSSRISVDLVQKAARLGAPVLIGASAPTALALDWAQRAGITVIGRARGETFDLYTHPHRIVGT